MKFTLLTPLVFLFLCLVPAQAQQDMPYIYYFDSVAGGMVVERADGSDSRVFEGVYAPVMWSPSGEWFVYRHNGALVRFSTDGIGNPFVVYEPNTTSNTVSHREIQFAPSNDLLAIMEYSINYDNYLGEAYLLVVDILSGEIVAEANAGYIDSYYTYSNIDSYIFWNDDDSKVHFDLFENVVTIQIDGKVSIQNLENPYSYGFVPFGLIDDGYMLFIEVYRDKLVDVLITDLVNNEEFRFQDILRERGYSFKWEWDETR